MPPPLLLTLTFAQSLDGRIATLTGQSQWISGDRTLRLAHRLRKTHDGILVGIGTVRKDDPELTCRLVHGHSPVRVVLDAGLSIPDGAKLVQTASKTATVILCAPGANRRRAEGLRSRGVQVAEIHDDGQGNLEIDEVLQFLAARGLRSLLIEGGSRVITSFLRSGKVQRLVVVTAPLIIGEGIPSVGDLGVRELVDAHRFRTVRVRRIGKDLVWELRADG
jgi:5-amino-6-(5-phosphoribosylamino)uracil reductase/diaminohydroxyphosphoribosylaminopyrimidine deaminase/5-amino-6-(5-phosphoribosylamino)uracil reductase